MAGSAMEWWGCAENGVGMKGAMMAVVGGRRSRKIGWGATWSVGRGIVAGSHVRTTYYIQRDQRPATAPGVFAGGKGGASGESLFFLVAALSFHLTVRLPWPCAFALILSISPSTVGHLPLLHNRFLFAHLPARPSRRPRDNATAGLRSAICSPRSRGRLQPLHCPEGR